MFAHLAPSVEKLENHRVLCVGDIMLDRFVYGSVDRISPEAPIPVLRTQREIVSLGGNGNVVRNIVSMGSSVDMLGIIGDDAVAAEMQSQIEPYPQIKSLLIKDTDRPTTLKIRYVAGSQQLLRTDTESSLPLSKSKEDDIIRKALKALEECDIVILSDYAKGVLSYRVIREIISAAKKRNIRVLIDTKGKDFSRYTGAYLLTPNRKELSEAVGFIIKTVEDAEKAARQLIWELDLGGVLAKLGGDGVCLIMKDEPAVAYQTTAREVFDVSGAGDSVVAAMALALAGGLSPADSAIFANIAGSIVVGKVGTATVSCGEIAKELRSDAARQTEEKICTREQIIERAARWRQQGFKVGFTNGCFDLLHPGHVSSIHQSRTACDKLIVALNSDTSVKRLKGPTRPVQNETARSIVLASLADVDAVTVFDEDTPLEIIKSVKPDVLVKGSDYKVEQVVGWKEVQSWGGKVVLADLIDGQSTSITIKRMDAPQ